MKEFNVTPWEVSGDIDYEKLVKRFGVFSLRDYLVSLMRMFYLEGR